MAPVPTPGREVRTERDWRTPGWCQDAGGGVSRPAAWNRDDVGEGSRRHSALADPWSHPVLALSSLGPKAGRCSGESGRGGWRLDEKGRALLTPRRGWAAPGEAAASESGQPRPSPSPGVRQQPCRLSSPKRKREKKHRGGKRQRQGGLRNQGPGEEPGLLPPPQPGAVGGWSCPSPPQATPAAGPTLSQENTRTAGAQSMLSTRPRFSKLRLVLPEETCFLEATVPCSHLPSSLE